MRFKLGKDDIGYIKIPNNTTVQIINVADFLTLEIVKMRISYIDIAHSIKTHPNCQMPLNIDLKF